MVLRFQICNKYRFSFLLSFKIKKSYENYLFVVSNNFNIFLFIFFFFLFENIISTNYKIRKYYFKNLLKIKILRF